MSHEYALAISLKIVSAFSLENLHSAHHLSGWYFLASSLYFNFTSRLLALSVSPSVLRAILLLKLTVLHNNLPGVILCLL